MIRGVPVPGTAALVRAGVVGGGGLGVAGALGYLLLWVQAKLARHLIGPPAEPPVSDGWYGSGRPGLRLVVLGDSTAAGIGATTPDDAPGGLLARGLADAADRAVHLRVHAVSGATSADLRAQVREVLREGRPDVAIICVGGNDVKNLVSADASVAHLARALRPLLLRAVPVVVGTCPDLGTVRPIWPPLRWIARRRGRTLAARQHQTLDALGVRAVATGALLGPTFARDADLFSADRFHPNDAGYRLLAALLLPALREAAGLAPVASDMDAVVDAVDEVRGPASAAQRRRADRLVLWFWHRLRAGESDEARARQADVADDATDGAAAHDDDGASAVAPSGPR